MVMSIKYSVACVTQQFKKDASVCSSVRQVNVCNNILDR